MQVKTFHPTATSEYVRDCFAQIVIAGQAVTDHAQMRLNIDRAAVLGMAFDGRGRPVGTIAAKVPNPRYARRIFELVGCTLPPTDFPLELGYLSILPEARSIETLRMLYDAIMSAANGHGIWLTTTTRTVTNRLLLARGWVRWGQYSGETNRLSFYTKDAR